MSLAVLATIALMLPAGCLDRTSATVSGSVTLNGQPLPKGLITFMAVDGAGGSGGGDVVGGKFSVKNLAPGKYVAHVSGVPEGKIIMPGDPETKRTRTAAEIDAAVDPIPADATGNDLTIEAQGGEQSLDFKLETKRPAAKSGG